MSSIGLSDKAKDLKHLKKNRRLLCKLISKIRTTQNIKFKEVVARQAIAFAVSTGHGIWSSPVIERMFCELSNKIKVELADKYEKDTCLFVLSMAFEYGGMEQVVERWIATDTSRKYSIAFTRMQGRKIPHCISHIVKVSQGKIFVLDNSLGEESVATELRKLASSYETIVLFTYEDDIVPLIAFGTEKFLRPIGLYNQCDHHFWLNVSIADIVGQLRDWGWRISEKNRGVKHSMMITVPAEVRKIQLRDKLESRAKVGLPITSKILISVGRSQKYNSVAGIDFMNEIAPVLRKDKRVVLILIGPEKSEFPQWRNYYEEFGDRLLLKGNIPHDKLYDYFFAADIAIGSMPTSGICAASDAVMCGCAFLDTSETIDFITKSDAFCETNDILRQRIFDLIDDDIARAKNVASITNAISEYCSREVFILNRDKFMNSLIHIKHSIHNFESTPTDYILEDYLMLSLNVNNARWHYFSSYLLLLKPQCLSRLLYNHRGYLWRWYYRIVNGVRRRLSKCCFQL